jgi:ABC-2 type transport system ATP-binding protein
MNTQTNSIIEINSVSKKYDSGLEALKQINLTVNEGEIFALLGPNGAGKTTLISLICGLCNPSSGTVTVAGFDNQTEYKESRKRIGLVPQELCTDMFVSVYETVCYSRGLFGLKKNPNFIEQVLKNLSLWEKKDQLIRSLSGGMKRRVLIAKALAHEPKILFLDEPSAGVDVELRKTMWDTILKLKKSGVTIILTTHYIEEAEALADRIGIITKGELLLTEKKTTLMEKLGKKQLQIHTKEILNFPIKSLEKFNLIYKNNTLTYTYHGENTAHSINELLDALKKEQIEIKELESKKSSLEEIFVELLHSHE